LSTHEELTINSFVTGPPLVLPPTPKGISETVSHVYKILSGEPIPPPLPSNSFVDNRDVARLMLYAVDHPEKADGERFIAQAGAPNYQAAADVLNKAYPEKGLDVGTPGKGYVEGYGFAEDAPVKVDASKAVKATGVDWIGFEQSTLDAAKAFEKYL
jgi:nucleoside-diphosphate-sugar epimerase